MEQSNSSKEQRAMGYAEVPHSVIIVAVVYLKHVGVGNLFFDKGHIL